MRIVHISPFYHPSIGGIETFCHELAVRTARLGHEVHVITYTAGNSPEEYDDDVTVHRVRPVLKLYKGRFSPLVRSSLKKIQPDIVHIQAPAPLTAEHCVFDEYKYIATHHNDLTLSRRPLYRISSYLYKKFVFPSFWKRMGRIISPSRSLLEASEWLQLVPDEKKGVIPNGVDIKAFCSGDQSKVRYRETLGLTAAHIGIFVGSMERWHAYKGVPTLIEALHTLTNLDLEFIFVGDGELRPKYERMARSLIINGKARFLGKIDQRTLINCYQASDFLVLPSTSVESFGIVLIEAMACGLPVICTDIPGPRDVVDDGLNGFKVRPGNSTELSNAIGRMVLMEPERLMPLGLNARAKTVEKYSYERIVESYLAEYSTLMNT